MYLKRSRKIKTKKHFRRRSIRHRSRTHNRKGGGKKELEAELRKHDSSRSTDSSTPQYMGVADALDSKRRELLHKIATAASTEGNSPRTLSAAQAAAARADAEHAASLARRAKHAQEAPKRAAASAELQARQDAQMARLASMCGPPAAARIEERLLHEEDMRQAAAIRKSQGQGR